jgi:hypothetical protein
MAARGRKVKGTENKDNGLFGNEAGADRARAASAKLRAAKFTPAFAHLTLTLPPGRRLTACVGDAASAGGIRWGSPTDLPVLTAPPSRMSTDCAMPETPEQQARQTIDALVGGCGRAVPVYNQVDLSAARDVALREVPLTRGRCDKWSGA